MATRKLFPKRLLNISNVASQSLMNCPISSSSLSVRSRVPKDSEETKFAPDPEYSRMSRWLMDNSTMIFSEIMQIPVRKTLTEKLRGINGREDRIRLTGPMVISEVETDTPSLKVEDTKKLLRATQIEIVKTKLRETERSWMTYAEFVSVCGEVSSDSNPDQGSRIAKMLDDSANVIILGDSVCLRPDQENQNIFYKIPITKSIESLLPLPKIHNPNDQRRIELKKLEAEKTMIDLKAHSLVRRELWAGLGYLILQTAGFMRLTFWELSWDVMEPICFYVTSIYFMTGYAFFLRTSKEPSFEGYYQSRFEAKQKRLIKLNEFDVERYDELKKLFCHVPSDRVSTILGAIEG